MSRRRWLWVLLPLIGAGCAKAPAGSEPPAPPGPGAVFSYPGDGQRDVPTGARLVLKFTDALTDAVKTPCTQTPGAPPTGAFCIVGPEGVVAAEITIAGTAQEILLAQPSALRAGTQYEVWVRPEALSVPAENLKADAPLFTFETRAQSPRTGAAPRLVSLNDDDPLAPKRPLLSFMPLRLLFSEPIDPFSAARAVHLVEVGEGSLETPVEGSLVADGTHVTFDPSQDLQAGHTYLLKLGAELTDVAGEPFEPLTLQLQPAAANPRGELYPLVLRVSEPGTDAAPSAGTSRLTGGPQNSAVVNSGVIGQNTLAITEGAVQAELAAPDVLAGPMAFTIRRGQRLRMSPMQIRLGGEIASGHQTGAVNVVFLTDATGFMTRSPLRAPEVLPDDARSPVTVELVFDAALSMEDPQGNAISTQTVMGLRVRGTAVVNGNELSIETLGTMELDTMGLEKAPTHLVMQLQTARGAAPVVPEPLPLSLLVTWPVQSAEDFPPDGTLLLTFSAPVDPASLSALSLSRVDGTPQPVPFTAITEGDAVAVRPEGPLPRGGAYQLTVGALRGIDGEPLAATSTLDFSVPVQSTTDGTAPLLTALYPGAPCALEPSALPDKTRCYGGKSSDTSYAPFELPRNRALYARFNQDLNPASLTLGTGCNDGSIRVLRLDAQGACTGAVPGALVKEGRGFTFTPDEPWEAGASYRLVLLRGGDNTCGANEVCGTNGRPFNTAPLDSVKSPPGGAPDRVAIPFTGAPAIDEAFLKLRSDPFSDVSGNGFTEAEEPTCEENQLALEVTGHNGAITSASLQGTDCDPNRTGRQVCVPLRGDLPVSVGAPVTPCPVDDQGEPNPTPGACIPVRVYPNSLEAGSITVAASALGIPLSPMESGMQVMRIREPGSAPAVGYILGDPAQSAPQFVLRQYFYIDVPDLQPPLGMRHSLHSAEANVLLKGPITFLPDGRMQVALRTQEDINLHVDIRGALDVTSWGGIDLRIPADSLHLTLRSPSPR